MREQRLFLLVFLLTIMFCLLSEPMKTWADDPLVVVSLGDSYSSGEGLGDYYDGDLPSEQIINSEDWLAHRSKKAWPGRLKIRGITLSEHRDENWFFAAASGAETMHLNLQQKKKYKRDGLGSSVLLLPQKKAFEKIKSGAADYVTLTIGGNDIGFTYIIECAALTGNTYLRPNWLNVMMFAAWLKYYAFSRKDIKYFYKNVRDLAGDQASIIVAGYPELLDGSGKGILFSDYEAKTINENVKAFNEELRKIVDECAEGKKEEERVGKQKYFFVDVYPSFEGHGAYTPEAEGEDEGPFIVGLKLKNADDIDEFNPISSRSFHPNEKGAKVYARCVQEKIDWLEERREAESLSDDDKETDLGESEYSISSAISEGSYSQTFTPDSGDEIYWALYRYLDATYGMEEDTENYHRFFSYEGEEGDFSVFTFRSYTGAYGKFYVDEKSGDVYSAWKPPFEDDYGEIGNEPDTNIGQWILN